jgi:hypothetical protein
MSHSFDATLKEIVAPHPEDFVAVFGLPQVQPAVALNIDLSTLTAATDVAVGFGEPLQEIADLNFQSGPDPDLAARCHLYSAALHFRFDVPVRTVIILLRPKAETGDLAGKLSYASGASGVEFRYEVVPMWQEPLAPYLHGGVNLLPLAVLCKLPEDRPLTEALREVVQEIERRLSTECEHVQAARLMTAACILTGLRVHRDELTVIYDGVRLMQDSSAYELFQDLGRIDGEQRLLLRQGTKRFGPPDEATVAALKAIKDSERLERLGDAVITAASWQELLATP